MNGYPIRTLHTAILYMAYDNGLVNCREDEKEVVWRCMDALQHTFNQDPMTIRQVAEDLARLTPSDLRRFCTGEQRDIYNIGHRCKLSHDTIGAVGLLFEAL